MKIAQHKSEVLVFSSYVNLYFYLSSSYILYKLGFYLNCTKTWKASKIWCYVYIKLPNKKTLQNKGRNDKFIISLVETINPLIDKIMRSIDQSMTKKIISWPPIAQNEFH